MNSNEINKKEEANLINIGGPVVDSEVTLCLYAHDIDIDTISAQLGIKPTNGVRRGEIIGRRRPVPIGRWDLEAPSELTFEEKLQYILHSTTADYSVWAALALQHNIQLRCSIYLHSWTEGFDLPAAMVAEIGARHWQFGLAMYSAEGEEIEDAFLSDKVKLQMKKRNTDEKR